MLIALVAAVALLAAYVSRESNRALETLYLQRLEPLEHLKKLTDLYSDVQFKANQIGLGRGDPVEAGKDVQKDVEEINTHWKILATTLQGQSDVQELNKASALAQKSKPAIADLLDALAKKDRMQTSLLALDLNDLVNAMSKQINVLVQLQLDHSSEEFQQVNTSYQRNMRSFAIAVALVIAGTVASAWLLIGAISVPIRQAVAIAKRVATGDMSEEISFSGESEMAEMLRALHDMQMSLGRVVLKVRDNADMLANASGEIAQGNHELSVRTEVQASSVEQSAASMGHLSAAVSQNAESAEQANQLAHSASAVAARGGQVVTQVIATMKEINESSRRISEIIGVIDGIAFQTNILALNAAVEAARAGEQGRGFAVVASEVRNLAGRSADAAKEIKNLIHTSVVRVDQGSKLVDLAGATMAEVVSAIDRVTNIMSEISSASGRQASGVNQVEETIQKMDQMTQQNAALVEQMAAAASGLKSQAEELVGTVAVFRVPNSYRAITFAGS
ncbi:methyl-accepting chemotaxis protein [Rhodoferax sp. GW822-FHT02A01]|uniref:methyl-accepting chemotaxis protein n=1 Tax=Rhodoferax sp. GW822-FHT02A01 TaxID=3141537 RepID=UPI00315D681E